MLFRIELTGESPLIHHSAAGLDPTTGISREIAEIAAKRGQNRTEADELRLKELECQRSLWLEGGQPTVPHSAIRAAIEAGARKLKQGPSVREGLIVQDVMFTFDRKRYGKSLAAWGKKCQFTVPVVVQRNRILRTRARFDLPWSVECTVFADPDLVDTEKLRTWCDIAGTRIGIGDWRPQKSGTFGRFAVASVEVIEQSHEAGR